MRNVILMGFMGSGKTCIGRRLSYHLRKCFIDVDNYIEKNQQRTVAEIFQEEGESYFRQLETDCLKELLRTKGSYIISLGGGTPMQPRNEILLKQLGKVVYLKVTPESIGKRLKKDKKRPLLQCENPTDLIETMLEEREPIYQKIADVVIETDGKKFSEIISEMKERLGNV